MRNTAKSTPIPRRGSAVWVVVTVQAPTTAGYLAVYPNSLTVPGTSNHGWGLAVDVATPQMARLINEYGAKYGWQKKWSDAQSEWWHFKYRAGVWDGQLHRDPIIRKGSTQRAAIKTLQKLLRAVGYSSVRVTGSYGILSRRAVRRFQKKHHLPVDGIVGPRTWGELRKVAR